MDRALISAWTLLGLSALSTCAANLLLNQASLATAGQRLGPVVRSLCFAGAIALYICDLILFTQSLQNLPVSLAVPAVSGIRIVATTILASLLFHEHFTLNHAIASGLIAVGIVIMTRP